MMEKEVEEITLRRIERVKHGKSSSNSASQSKDVQSLTKKGSLVTSRATRQKQGKGDSSSTGATPENEGEILWSLHQECDELRSSYLQSIEPAALRFIEYWDTMEGHEVTKEFEEIQRIEYIRSSSNISTELAIAKEAKKA